MLLEWIEAISLRPADIPSAQAVQLETMAEWDRRETTLVEEWSDDSARAAAALQITEDVLARRLAGRINAERQQALGIRDVRRQIVARGGAFQSGQRMSGRADRAQSDAQQRHGRDIVGNVGEQQAYGECGRTAPQTPQRPTKALGREAYGQIGKGAAQRTKAVDQWRGNSSCRIRSSPAGRIMGCPARGCGASSISRAGSVFCSPASAGAACPNIWSPTRSPRSGSSGSKSKTIRHRRTVCRCMRRTAAIACVAPPGVGCSMTCGSGWFQLRSAAPEGSAHLVLYINDTVSNYRTKRLLLGLEAASLETTMGAQSSAAETEPGADWSVLAAAVQIATVLPPTRSRTLPNL